jgi:hypothetical protein
VLAPAGVINEMIKVDRPMDRMFDTSWQFQSVRGKTSGEDYYGFIIREFETNVCGFKHRDTTTIRIKVSSLGERELTLIATVEIPPFKMVSEKLQSPTITSNGTHQYTRYWCEPISCDYEITTCYKPPVKPEEKCCPSGVCAIRSTTTDGY